MAISHPDASMTEANLAMLPPPASLDSFKAELARLVARFSGQLPFFTGPDYSEAKLREDFLNPFFAALGWDVGNRKGLIHTEREVDIEVRAEFSGRQRRADYVFRIDRREWFTCEAKKPSESLHEGHAYQAKSDAYARGIAFAILSDFEETRMYVVGARPTRADPMVMGQWRHFHFLKYEESAAEIWGLLAYENVRGGSIPRLMDGLPKRPSRAMGTRGYVLRPDRSRAMDAEFLSFLDGARQRLGSDLLKHNAREDLLLDNRLNEAAQRILDRLVFIRICEDRAIDTGTLLFSIFRDWWRQREVRPRLRRGPLEARRTGARPDAMAEEPPSSGYAPPEEGTLYRAIVAHVRAIDHRPASYQPFLNGQLFKPHFSEELVVGDEWLANFIDDLSSDEEGYNFASIKVEILGDAYERFLGKVLRPHGRGAVIEEKPEVRKAGGVYYTPRYIVDYIVEETVGRQLAGKSPAEVARLRFIDPACGSGSFLIRVYERVMEHYLQHFDRIVREFRRGDPSPEALGKFLQGFKEDFRIDAAGNVRLTPGFKRQVLLDNVFGVDLDPKAVEVTQLSLYLKMLEGENRDSVRGDSKEFFSRTPLLPSLDKNIRCGNSIIASDFSMEPAEIIRVNAFDWDIGFASIVRVGGFDAVVGNPPWVDLKGMDPATTRYVFEHFHTTSNRMNIYAAFMHRSLDLVRDGGHYGVITPSSFLTQSSYSRLRALLLNHQVESIIRLPDDVFEGVTAESAISIYRKRPPATPLKAIVYPARLPLGRIGEAGWVSMAEIDQRSWTGDEGIFRLHCDPREMALLRKITDAGSPLETWCEFCLGLTPYDKARGHSASDIKNRVFHSKVASGKEWKPLLEGADVSRFRVEWGGNEYIRYGPWLGAPREQRFFKEPRILVRQIISGQPPRIYAGYCEDEFYNSQVAFNLLARQGGPVLLKAVLGVLCSTLMTWYHRHRFLDPTKSTFQKILVQDAKRLPIPSFLHSDGRPTEACLALASVVDRIHKLQAQPTGSASALARAAMENAVQKADHEIDLLVYALYGLTPDEIAWVERPA